MTVRYLLRRLLLAVPTLIGVAVIVFVLLRVVPGNPIAMMIPPGATEADIANLRRIYGLDQSILTQFLIWAGEILRGDFGTSISLRQDVVLLIAQSLPATLELAFAATVIACTLGGALAIIGTLWQRRWPEVAVDAAAGFGLAIPDFLWALVFVLVLGVLVPVFPISGRVDPAIGFDFTTRFFLFESLVRGELRMLGEVVRHLVLPALALALPLAAVIARMLKSSLAEAMAQDYVLLAQTRGFARGSIIVREALRNALIPTLTLTGVQFTFLVGGTVLIERIFGYPGIGNMAIGAVLARDLPLIQGLILTFAVLFIFVNLSIDLLYAMLNPRVRHG